MSIIAPHGPFTCEVAFYVTNGTDTAEIKFDCPIGHAPDEADLAILAGKALDAIRDAAGDGWRFQTRDEFVQGRLREQTGAHDSVKFAVPFGAFSMEWAQ